MENKHLFPDLLDNFIGADPSTAPTPSVPEGDNADSGSDSNTENEVDDGTSEAGPTPHRKMREFAHNLRLMRELCELRQMRELAHDLKLMREPMALRLMRELSSP